MSGGTQWFLVALVTASLVTTAPALAGHESDAIEIFERELNRLDIDRSRIKSVWLAPQKQGNLNVIDQYTGWVSFTDCVGNLAIELTSANGTRSVYTTAQCSLDGVPHQP